MKKPECPKCHSSKVIEIVYGSPSYELFQDAEKGKVKLGGCCIDFKNPNWHCKVCKHEWQDFDTE